MNSSNALAQPCPCPISEVGTEELAVPPSIAAIDSSWITEVLRSAGALGTDEIRGHRLRPLREEKGLNSQVAAIDIDYRQRDTGPESVVVKLIRTPPKVAIYQDDFQYTEIEHFFFTAVAARSQIRAPQCFHAQRSPEDKAAVFVLEEIVDHDHGRALDTSFEQAALAVRSIAGFHAGWWDHPALSTMVGMPVTNRIPVQRWYENSIGKFVELWSHLLSPRTLHIVNRLIDSGPDVGDELSKGPVTLVHGDFRPENILYDRRGAQQPCVVDWQRSGQCRGVYDLAYYFTMALSPEARRDSESDLLRAYHHELCRAGVTAYTLADCVADYRVALLQTARRFVLTFSVFDFVEDGWRRFAESTLQRLDAVLCDNDIDDMSVL